MRIYCPACLSMVAAALSLLPLEPGSRPAPRPAPAAAPTSDGASVAALLAAVYDVLSGPAGQPRDWARLRALCHPSARLAAVVRGRDGAELVPLTVEDYIERFGPALERDGFFEREIARRSEFHGELAHVWSTYETRRRRDDPQPEQRGINSFQCVRVGGRWWLLHAVWQAEADAGPLPAPYLPPG